MRCRIMRNTLLHIDCFFCNFTGWVGFFLKKRVKNDKPFFWIWHSFVIIILLPRIIPYKECFQIIICTFRGRPKIKTNFFLKSKCEIVDRRQRNPLGYSKLIKKKSLTLYPSRQNRQKVTLEEWVFVKSALNMQCHIVKNTLLHTVFLFFLFLFSWPFKL